MAQIMRSYHLFSKHRVRQTTSNPRLINYRRIGPMKENALKRAREALLMSKAELARAAKVSPITISRIENGLPCRMDTKRKIILALGLRLSDKDKIFKDE